MIERSDSTLLIAWQEFMDASRPGHDDSRSRLVTKVSSDGGRTWEHYRPLIEPVGDQINVYSPSFLKLSDALWLLLYFAKHNRSLTSGFIAQSTDEGITWSKPEHIWHRQPYGAANHVVQLHSSGRILYPITIQQGELWTPTDHAVATCLYSDDGGCHWKVSDNWVDLPRRGAMEPHVVELADGSMAMVMRTQLGALYMALSTDRGETWSAAQRMPVQAPESSPELLRVHEDQGLMLIWNNSQFDPSFGHHFGKRSPLSVAYSSDEGRSWSTPFDIESDPQRGYTNSASIFLSDGRLLVTYFTAPYLHVGEMDVSRADLRAALVDRSLLNRLGVESKLPVGRNVRILSNDSSHASRGT